MSRIRNFVGGVVGLGAEAYAQRNSSSETHRGAPPSRSLSSYEEYLADGATPQHSSSDSDYEHDDAEDWDLDAAQDTLQDNKPQNGEHKRTISVNQILHSFNARHPGGVHAHSSLPCPVIIPQRRPGTHGRGFVQAYAPVLADCGIDQTTFLEFLQAFEQSVKASPVFTVIGIAAVGVRLVPSGIAKGVGVAVGVANKAVQGVQVNRQTNHFLDSMNDKLFKPLGLFCLIMSYKPNSTTSAEAVNVSQIISKQVATASGMQRYLQPSSGTTHGEIELPEAAPLIFPILDAAAPDAQKRNAVERAGHFIAEYYDKRSRASYASKNPDSSLVTPSPQFASRLGDPSHPSNNGSLVGMATGGAFDPRARREGRRTRHERHGDSRNTGASSASDQAPTQPRQRRRDRRQNGEGRQPRGPLRQGVRRVLNEDVLYLMVVNMPSQAEMDAAMAGA